MSTYKEGAVREVTLSKYRMTLRFLKKVVPNLQVCQFNRNSYQQIINEYAKTHELVTTKDFATQINACIRDALDDDVILKNPMRRIVMKGCPPNRQKKKKYLDTYQLHALLNELNLDRNQIN